MQTVRLDIPYPVLVEGKYDKIKLSSVINARILTTDGFAVFNSKEKRALLSELAKKTRIIVVTDSDSGGRVIRNHIKGILPPDRIINLYIPSVKGKERRKTAPSKEGLLGVEGMDADILREVFLPFASENAPNNEPISRTRLYELGLLGGENSSALRRAVCRELKIPEDMSSGAFLDALNLLLSKAEAEESISRAVKNFNTEGD